MRQLGPYVIANAIKDASESISIHFVDCSSEELWDGRFLKLTCGFLMFIISFLILVLGSIVGFLSSGVLVTPIRNSK